MPQLLMEYSTNIIEKAHVTNALNEINHLLVQVLPTHLDSCKSRAVEHTIYCIGDNAPNNAFIHIHLRVLPGRTKEKLESVGSSIIQLLSNFFQQSQQVLNLQLSVEINELATTYFKA